MLLMTIRDGEFLKTEVYAERGNTCTLCKYQKNGEEWKLMYRFEQYPLEAIEYQYGICM